MFDIIKSYIKDEAYYLIIIDRFILIKNYDKLIELLDNNVTIQINNKMYFIKGSNFKLVEINNKDLKISGLIERIEIL